MKYESYTAFSEAFHNAGGQLHAPLNGTIEITHRCPLDVRALLQQPADGGRGRRASAS